MVNLSEKKLQKNRFSKKIKLIKLKFSETAFLIKKGFRLELLHIFFIKKLFKKLLKKKKNNSSKSFKKIWFYLCSNFIIQKKSKNSRMGKGKGFFVRKIIIIKPNQIFAEFSGISFYRLNNVLFKINKKLNSKIFLYKKKKITKTLWTKKNKYYYYIHKYLR